MDFLILIKNGCDNLTATVAPSIDCTGSAYGVSLATIMLVWFGVQEALGIRSGRPRLQRGQISELLPADYIRLLLCEVL